MCHLYFGAAINAELQGIKQARKQVQQFEVSTDQNRTRIIQLLAHADRG